MTNNFIKMIIIALCISPVLSYHRVGIHSDLALCMG